MCFKEFMAHEDSTRKQGNLGEKHTYTNANQSLNWMNFCVVYHVGKHVITTIIVANS